MSSALWVDKYKPVTSSDIIGNKSEILKIKKWIEVFKTRKVTSGFKNVSSAIS